MLWWPGDVEHAVEGRCNFQCLFPTAMGFGFARVVKVKGVRFLAGGTGTGPGPDGTYGWGGS